MGVDWVVLDKEVDGRKVDAWETLGARRLAEDDPDTLAEFRRRYELNQQALGPAPVRKWWQVSDGESKARRELRRYWHRPFEEVLADALAEDPPPVMIYASPETEVGLAAIAGAGRECDFRGNELRDDRNDVIAKTDFDDGRVWNDMTPDEMRQMADDLAAALVRYRGMDLERDEEAEQTVEDAVRWLRFWAGKGHAIQAWS